MSHALKKAVEDEMIVLDENGRPPESWYKTVCPIEESRTRQEFAKDCDINRIVDRFTRTGELPFVGRKNLGMYADVSEVPNYESALAFIIHAKESFEKLDINVKERFHNSPQELIDFLKDKNNEKEARKLGLLEPERPPANPPPEEPE